MNADRIREALNRRGYSLTRIASILGYSPGLISMVISRKRLNHRIAIAIATAVGKSVETVFPEVPLYHGPLMTDAERDLELVRLLQEQGIIRRSA